jgi:hypothetical protein
MAGWCLGLRFGPGASALNAGVFYILWLGAAGVVMGFVEGELSCSALAGLYLGQVVALGGQVLLGFGSPPEGLLWQPLFILSVTLAAALGGAFGACLKQDWE